MSSRSTKAPDADHVVRLLRETAREMGVTETGLPHILLFYANPHDAAVGFAATHDVHVQTVVSTSGQVYEIWINSENVDAATALGIAGTLSLHSRQNLSEARLIEIRDRVCARVHQAVPVNALRSKR